MKRPEDIDADEILLDMFMPYLRNWISKSADWPLVDDKIAKD